MDSIRLIKDFCDGNSIACVSGAPLSQYCTFKTGGNAALLITPESENQLAAVAKLAHGLKTPLLTLGKGSNMIFSDSGFNGAVVHIGQKLSDIRLCGESAIFAQSGATLTQLCQFALQNSLSGLEFAYGIPGTVGGAVSMNAGAYEHEIKEVLTGTEHICESGEKGAFVKDELELSYRRSVYSDSGSIVTGAYFGLKKGDQLEIRARMDDYMNRRRDKQPLDYPSAGSVFKRPPGAYASALIDRCGLKGRRVGGAMISEKHAGFIINYDSATSADILELITIITTEVEQKTGYKLECEIKIIQ